MKELLQALDAIHPITPELAGYLQTILVASHFKKGDHLLKNGKPSVYVYFIRSGLLRSYYQKADKQVTQAFLKEGDLALLFSGCHNPWPFEALEALEETEVLYFRQDQLQHLYAYYREFDTIGRKLMERYFMESTKRARILCMHNAFERVALLEEHYPDLPRRVKAKYLASFIGLSEEMYSRTRSAKRKHP